MNLFERVSRLVTANINHMVDQAEEPEVMIKQLVRDIEGSLVGLRRETVAAIARVKHLERRIQDAEGLAHEHENQAALALGHGDEELARALLARKLGSIDERDALAAELEAARKLESRLKDDMLRLQAKADDARRRQDLLIRRKRAAEARLRSHAVTRRSDAALSAASGRVDALAFDAYAEAIGSLEATAEAEQELAAPHEDAERRLRKLTERSKVDAELERLRQTRSLAG